RRPRPDPPGGPRRRPPDGRDRAASGGVHRDHHRGARSRQYRGSREFAQGGRMTQELEAPLHVFRFELSFKIVAGSGGTEDVCSGAFAECTGLEATMEPKAIKAGGANYGPVQRPGPVSFATVILKRGMTSNRDLFKWFQLVNGGSYAYRLSAEIEMRDTDGTTVVTWG